MIIKNEGKEIMELTKEQKDKIHWIYDTLGEDVLREEIGKLELMKHSGQVKMSNKREEMEDELNASIKYAEELLSIKEEERD